jgi:hypothetical protein
MASKILEPYEMVDQDQYYRLDQREVRQMCLMLLCAQGNVHLPQLAKKAGLVRLMNGNVCRFILYTPWHPSENIICRNGFRSKIHRHT